MSGGSEARAKGAWGEELVAEDLRRKGWRILDRNFRCRSGEIDVIAAKDGYLAFIEVKLRKNDRFAPAKAFVTAEKQRKLRIAAQLYLQRHRTELQPRFDVAEVYAPQGEQTVDPTIEYIENAF